MSCDVTVDWCNPGRLHCYQEGDMSQNSDVATFLDPLWYIATGSYDTFIRIWAADGSVVQSLAGHGDAISSLEASIPTAEENCVLISGSKDHTVRMWELSLTSSQEATNPAIILERPVKVLKGHTSSVQCVASNGSGTAVCSGSWDCSIKVWSNLVEENGVSLTVHSKKRKLDASAEAQELEVGTTITLEGHTQCVSAVSWGERDSIVSASWDQSIRSWDVETNINTETLIGPKALHCLSVGGDNMALFAAGGADPVLRIWDPRMPGTNTPIFQLASHKAWITACKWHRHSRNHILSASHDGSIKLWDLRSKIPLQTVDAHKGKVIKDIKFFLGLRVGDFDLALENHIIYFQHLSD
ncbi:hypothetical protein L7F22_062208 [Adiantum nelumboides]|nr:hypothetical protein [Adiantum nelumboides]